MVFSSLLFLTLFLPITILLYYIVPRRGKNALLLAASIFFYAWGEPIHIVLMLITTVYMWLLGIGIEKSMARGRKRSARLLLVLGVIFSVGTLAYYKYSGFILEKLLFMDNVKSPALPIGISFYTFQVLSYVIDVYRGEVRAQKNWVSFAMYISMFPQLIAGPIVRYADVEGQINQRHHSASLVCEGIQRFTLGLGKKVLLANEIGVLWKGLSAMENLSVLGAWGGAIAYALQIYFDFSAYSDMAIGLGKMFGFEFTENFHYPYQAKSITEFWRRWHITLGTWFREYVYIPLGGNRKGKRRLVFNLLIVWSLTGLWHGADWQFLLWGVYYFLFLVFEKFVLLRRMEKWPVLLRHLYTLLVVLFGWVIFGCEDILAAKRMVRAMFGVGTCMSDSAARFLLSQRLPLILGCLIGMTEFPKCVARKLRRKIQPVRFEVLACGVTLLILGISISFLAADAYNPFLYFRF